MEYILTVEEMRRADSIAIQEVHIPGLILMENAGLKTAQCIASRFSPIAGKSIGIFCGKGNNGGDGFVIGRHLSRMGARVVFWLCGKRADVQGDARVNMEIAEKMDLPVTELEQWDPRTHLGEFDLLVDALLGTGLKGKVRGIYADLIRSLNQFRGPVIAVDTPSGLNCDSGKPLGQCVRADLTVTMGNLKTGMLFYPGREFVGELFVADLNVPDSVFTKISSKKWLYRLKDYQDLLPARPPDAYKNTFGKILVLAGSTGLTGAASLSSLSALRSGAGMVILGCPQSLNPIFEEKLTEVMSDPLPETQEGTLMGRAFDSAQKSLAWCHVVALGPGLSTHPETRKFVHRVLQEQSHPMVIDADGLNNLTDATQLVKQYENDLVLTPHVGELARLTNLQISEIQANAVEVVREYAQQWQVVLLLKGVPTLIGDPEGNIYFNLSGNAGMATAGSGDVLTGLIAGFLAQRLNARDAAILGAFVHGLAGDRAKSLIGERGIIAGDLMEQIPDVLTDLEDGETVQEYYTEFGLRLY